MPPTVETVGDVAVVLLSWDELDITKAEEFKREIAPVLESHRKVVLDLTGVRFLDSVGCGAILSCFKRLAATGGELKLCQATPSVRNVLELIRFHRICDVLETRDAAVQAFGDSA